MWLRTDNMMFVYLMAAMLCIALVISGALRTRACTLLDSVPRTHACTQFGNWVR